ncbi:zinc knuckle CX2CX4HX4C [Artemisia annua]|uniref:Zinc knuckle CX2CX4HX4C n=1 Tax=Artemisia annua TaxID=35608 RepID=A0A2U1N002_ARTAN|nr:zinc knuckle CX2CX4HX4C [Artemisia annua]
MLNGQNAGSIDSSTSEIRSNDTGDKGIDNEADSTTATMPETPNVSNTKLSNTENNGDDKKSDTATSNGISALASRLGKPLIMDDATASMCQVGVNRGGYARVLVEVQAQKELPAKIDVLYKNSLNEVIGTKSVQVDYCWKPPCCKGCGVFGHNDVACPKIVGSKEASKELDKEVELEGFTEVENKKANRQNGKSNGSNKVPQGNNNAKGNFGDKGNFKRVFKPKQPIVSKDKSNVGMRNDVSKHEGMNNHQSKSPIAQNKSEIHLQKGNGKGKNVDKSNSNQFEVLGNLKDETREILDMEARGIVDVFVNQKRKPTSLEQAKWNEDMLCYYRARWDALVTNNENECQSNHVCNSEIEDVVTDKSGIGLSMERNEVVGSDANVLQNC